MVPEMEAARGVEIYPEQELTEKILGAAFTVHNALGCGFLEKVYLRALGLACEHEVAFKVKYKNVEVGDYFADLIVERRVVVELKACTALGSSREAQILNYFKASNVKVGLLMNFGRPKLQYRRFVR
jgi:GxxExxY protein